MNYVTATALTFGARVIAFLFAAITSIALARWLAPDERGDYAVATTLSALLVAFTNLGLAQAHIHLVGRDRRAYPRAVTNSLAFVGAASAIVGAGVLLAAIPLREAFPVLRGSVLMILFLSVPGGLTYPLLHALLQARRDFVWTSAITVFAYAVQLAALAALVGWLDLGLQGALVAWLGAHFALALVTVAIVLRRGQLGPLDLAMLRDALRLGAPGYAGSIALLVTTRAALVVGGLALAPREVGNYAVAVALAELLWYLSESAAFGLAPFVADTEVSLSTITPFVNRAILLFTAIIASLVWMLADPIVAILFGPGYDSAPILLRWYLPGVVAFSAARVLAGDLIGRGRPDVSLVPLAIGGATSVALAVALVPSFGIAMGAAGTTVAYTASGAVMVARYCGLTGLEWREVVVPRPADLRLLGRFARRIL